MRPVFALLLFAAASPLFAQTSPCPKMRPDVDIVFQGKTLREIADITDPELRTINRMITAFCLDDAGIRLDAYRRAHPDDHRAKFVEARLAIFSQQYGEGLQIEFETVAAHPEFLSMQVLMASAEIAQGEFQRANDRLKQAASAAPNDLWLFLNRVQLQSTMRSSSRPPETAALLKAIVMDPQFPPNAHEVMLEQLVKSNYDDETTEWAHKRRIALPLLTPSATRKFDYATWLIEKRHRTDEGRKLLVGADKCGVCDPQAFPNLIAKSYLIDAAKIDPAPTARNARLVHRATDAAGGDLAVLWSDVSHDPNLTSLLPFFANVEESDDPWQTVDTPLCAAVKAEPPDADAVRKLLDGGKKPDKPCTGHMTPVSTLIRRDAPATEAHVAMMRALLEHGADPNPSMQGISDTRTFCQAFNPSCKPYIALLEPLWQAADAAAGK